MMVRTILAIITAVLMFAVIVTLMLWFNNWGSKIPSDIQQLMWAFNFVVWPVLTFVVIKNF